MRLATSGAGKLPPRREMLYWIGWIVSKARQNGRIKDKSKALGSIMLMRGMVADLLP